MEILNAPKGKTTNKTLEKSIESNRYSIHKLILVSVSHTLHLILQFLQSHYLFC